MPSFIVAWVTREPLITDEPFVEPWTYTDNYQLFLEDEFGKDGDAETEANKFFEDIIEQGGTWTAQMGQLTRSTDLM
jgi:hypothetical protein